MIQQNFQSHSNLIPAVIAANAEFNIVSIDLNLIDTIRKIHKQRRINRKGLLDDRTIRRM